MCWSFFATVDSPHRHQTSSRGGEIGRGNHRKQFVQGNSTAQATRQSLLVQETEASFAHNTTNILSSK